MRKKHSLKGYFQILLVLLGLLSIPRNTSESIQGTSVAFIAPAWEQLQHIKKALQHVTDIKITKSDGTVTYAKEEIQRLQLENQLLKNEIQRLTETLEGESMMVPFTEAVPAQVIFRTLSSWNQSLWINVGSATNASHSSPIVVKNSPVVIGKHVVGVVDYVGTHQSRVRLITDTELTPSVRVMRESEGKTWFLAKGELRGGSTPSWRDKKPLLKGIGFNYDFPDEEGPARDLRTGAAIGSSEGLPALPIIQQDDLLVTTGLDGVFPPGLHVAKVSHVALLKEGNYYYEIEAIPTLSHLNHLSIIYVIPPLVSQSDDPELIKII